MTKEGVLAGLKVVVTRPKHQSENLVRLIKTSGGEAVRFPLLEIKAQVDQQYLDACLSSLRRIDHCIFISPNAVKYGLTAIDARNRRIDLQGSKIWAIGRATEKVLRESGIKEVLIPSSGCNSEALLASDEMQLVDGRRVFIFRGGNGRNILSDTLEQRGAAVTSIDVYSRALPEINIAQGAALLNGVDVITVTSGQALQNLFSLYPPERNNFISKAIFLLGSERIYKKEKTRLGEICCIIAADPGDETMMNALKRWVGEQENG